MRAYDSILVYGPPDSTAALYTVDGILFIPGMQPLQGRQSILDFLSPIWASSTVLTAKTTVDTIQVFGGHALSWGTYEEIAGPRGQAPSLYRGRVVMEWAREADGRWRIARVLTQPTPPPAPAAEGPTRPLEGTEWTLTEFGGHQAPLGAGGKPATLRLSAADHRAAGFGGCNRFSGGYRIAGDSLVLGPIAMTMMACPTGMEVERQFGAVLAATRRFHVDGITLRTSRLHGRRGPAHSPMTRRLASLLTSITLLGIAHGTLAAQAGPEAPDASIAVLTTALYTDQANVREASDSTKSGLGTEVLRQRLEEQVAAQLRSFAVTDSLATSPEALELTGRVPCDVKVACALMVARRQDARWVVMTKVSKTSNLIWVLSAQLIRVETGTIVLDDSTELKGDPDAMIRVGMRIFADRVVRTVRDGGVANNFPS